MKFRLWHAQLLQSARKLAQPPLFPILKAAHHGLAVLGLCILALGVLVYSQPQWRIQVYAYLSSNADAERNVTLDSLTPAALTKVSDGAALAAQQSPVMLAVTDPAKLPRQQAAVTDWIAKRYRVAPELVARLVSESWHIGKSSGIDPTLLLAIIAIESRFNPFAQSSMGAEGLMQVMTHIHSDKYHSFGGETAAFDPIANLQVGVKVLEEHVRRAGSLRGGLRQYVGASGPDDGGYTDKVLAERARLLKVAYGVTEGTRRAAREAIPGMLVGAPTAQTAASSSTLPPENHPTVSHVGNDPLAVPLVQNQA